MIMADAAQFTTPEGALDYLRAVGGQADDAIDLAESALALGLMFLPGVHIDRYRQHLKKLTEQAREEHETRLRAGQADTLSLRAQTLRTIIHGAHGYQGDEKTYNDIQNANLIRVIERRKGLPVAIGILYLHIARVLSWAAAGLSFPAHFILRLEKDGERIILDPFREGGEMDAASLRTLLKSIVGERAELSHDFYAPVSSREILVRLQNNLKKRLIDGEDYAGAIQAAEAMAAFAPHEYRTHLDRGVLHAKLGHVDKARSALKAYVALAPSAKEKAQGRALLAEIEKA